MRAPTFMSLSASAARPSLLWRTRTCSSKDPVCKARRKGFLAGINYTPGLLHLPNYVQLLHPWASPWPGEGEAHTAPSLPLPTRVQGQGSKEATADATWSGRHFSQIRVVMVPTALLIASHHGASRLWGKEDGIERRCPSD